MAKIRKINRQIVDCCTNCKHLGWGPSEGWDKCGKTGHVIGWCLKSDVVCDDYERCIPGVDPRNK